MYVPANLGAPQYPDMRSYGLKIGAHHAPQGYQHSWLAVTSWGTWGASSRAEAQWIVRFTKVGDVPRKTRKTIRRNPKRDPNLKYMGNYGDVTWKTYGGQFVLWNKLLNEIEVIGFANMEEDAGEGYPYKYEVGYASFTMPIEQTEARDIEGAKKTVGWAESERSGSFRFKDPVDREIMLALAMISSWGYAEVIITTDRMGEAIKAIRSHGVPASALR